MGLMRFLKDSRTFERFDDVLKVRRPPEDVYKDLKAYFEGLTIF